MKDTFIYQQTLVGKNVSFIFIYQPYKVVGAIVDELASSIRHYRFVSLFKVMAATHDKLTQKPPFPYLCYPALDAGSPINIG